MVAEQRAACQLYPHCDLGVIEALLSAAREGMHTASPGTAERTQSDCSQGETYADSDTEDLSGQQWDDVKRQVPDMDLPGIHLTLQATDDSRTRWISDDTGTVVLSPGSETHEEWWARFICKYYDHMDLPFQTGPRYVAPASPPKKPLLKRAWKRLKKVGKCAVVKPAKALAAAFKAMLQGDSRSVALAHQPAAGELSSPASEVQQAISSHGPTEHRCPKITGMRRGPVDVPWPRLREYAPLRTEYATRAAKLAPVSEHAAYAGHSQVEHAVVDSAAAARSSAAADAGAWVADAYLTSLVDSLLRQHGVSFKISSDVLPAWGATAARLLLDSTHNTCGAGAVAHKGCSLTLKQVLRYCQQLQQMGCCILVDAAGRSLWLLKRSHTCRTTAPQPCSPIRQLSMGKASMVADNSLQTDTNEQPAATILLGPHCFHIAPHNTHAAWCFYLHPANLASQAAGCTDSSSDKLAMAAASDDDDSDSLPDLVPCENSDGRVLVTCSYLRPKCVLNDWDVLPFWHPHTPSGPVWSRIPYPHPHILYIAHTKKLGVCQRVVQAVKSRCTALFARGKPNERGMYVDEVA